MKAGSEGFIIIISVALMVVAGAVVLVSSTKGPGEPMPSTSELAVGAGRTGTAPGSPSASPSGDNVNRGYYQQIRTFESRLEENAGDTTAMRSLGRLLQDAHQNEDAVRWYRRYLELNPASNQVRIDLGSALAASGNWTGAEEAMESLLERHPDDARALYNLGAIAANRGDAATARTFWNRALELGLEPDLEETVASSLTRLDAHSSR